MKKNVDVVSDGGGVVILPFFINHGGEYAVRRRSGKARFRLLRRSINPGFSR
ncbi:Uncharacterised protein [Salmonella enterica subsp. enterica]|nr:Uncharacterised protein [Salmonella enterica subsp. enterica]